MWQAQEPSALQRPVKPPRASKRWLLAYPAQRNFSGVLHPLRWIQPAHAHGYDVLLDAAASAPTNRLDLSVVRPDFVPVSWYKVFGYPTRRRLPDRAAGGRFVAVVEMTYRDRTAGISDLTPRGLSATRSVSVDMTRLRTGPRG